MNSREIYPPKSAVRGLLATDRLTLSATARTSALACVIDGIDLEVLTLFIASVSLAYPNQRRWGTRNRHSAHRLCLS